MMLRKFASKNTALAAVVSLALAGCVNLAPEYERPQAPKETSAAWAVSPAEAGVKEGELLTWDKFFLDERLKKVIQMALDNNRDLRNAMLEVERLMAQYRVSRADLFPTVSAGGSVTNSMSSVDSITPGTPRVTHAYAANLAMTSYEVDFFGRVRNLNEQALQAYLQGEDARRSAQNTLIANVATTWLSIGADRANLALAKETLESQTATYELTKKSYEGGTANLLELNQAKTTVASAQVSLQTAINSLAQDENALRVLVGANVADDLLPKGLELGATMPATLPAGLPSEVLLARPDIASAERDLRSANANIGVARAAFFPSITLTGSIGTLSADMSNLFNGGRGAWSFAPSLSLPIFTGGSRTATLEAANIAQKQSVAAYEKAIQTAFQEVNDALSTENTVVERMKAQDDLVEASVSAYNLSLERYKHGVDDFLTVLDSQRSMVSAQQGQISTRLERAVSLVTLYKVLGGGQESASEPEEPEKKQDASS